ncbi:metallophosphoesterase [Pelosinus sp. UFO1]|uniref:metallophosphoesterase n=1 Tax=Pelosinus sp. UFO1 TaxID=484770 RepID=UPI0004D1FD36|nr:metallophosphoesterase [Pelosinus sp. UFO1]AIF52671.1 Calcineurin-like phosphoesterase superfamily domain containing protein [Pelosinus sp. UFO1]
MRTIQPILMLLILIISYGNWRLLVKWFPTWKSYISGIIYWLMTAVSWSLVGASWLLRPDTAFYYERIIPLVDLSFVWVIGQILLLLFFPILFALRKILHRVHSNEISKDNKGVADTSRRTFIQSILYAAPVLALGVSGAGVYSAEKEMVVRHFPLSFPGLDQDLKGFKIAQISDTHLGPFFTLDRLDEVIHLVIQEKPDMVVITGDLIDDLSLLVPAVEKFNQMDALIPYGIYFCWGNHEYFRDINRIRVELGKSKIHVLQNSNIPITVGTSTFYLLGVDYPWPQNVSEKDAIRQQFMKKAVENIPNGAFRVLLAHHPDFLFEGFAAKIPLTLSGHTHGGQVNFLGHSLLPVSYYYMRGLYQENDTYGYVNTGAGQWIPFRLGCPPEISIFTLENK